VFDVNDLIGGMRSLLNLTVGEKIVLSFEPGPGLWPVRTDRSQLEASVLNLVTNARDAMPAGGTLSIASRNQTVGDDLALEFGVQAGEYVVVDVTDTGVGMAPDVAAAIFEPFFTTKRAGSGTGLGLSMVFGFVAQSGGVVRVRTAPGEGRRFRCTFRAPSSAWKRLRSRSRRCPATTPQAKPCWQSRTMKVCCASWNASYVN